VLAVLSAIGRLIGRPVETSFDDWRSGDQYFFVADTRKLQHTLGWSARVGWESGLQHLAEWLIENRFAGRLILRRDRKVSA
jgi:CDP-paratose 2-epimerase